MNTEQVTHGTPGPTAGYRLQVTWGREQDAAVEESRACVDRPFLRYATLVLCLISLFFLFSSSSFAEKDKDLKKHFGLIYGTAYGPDDRPVYGAKIEIHPVGQKHPHWELMSDHQGEFALRVPPGPGDYRVSGEAFIVSMENGVPQSKKKKKIKAEKTVHIEAEERQDVGLHLAE